MRALRHRAHGRGHFALRAGGWRLRRVDVDNVPRGTAPGDLWWLGRVGDVGGWVLRRSSGRWQLSPIVSRPQGDSTGPCCCRDAAGGWLVSYMTLAQDTRKRARRGGAASFLGRADIAIDRLHRCTAQRSGAISLRTSDATHAEDPRIARRRSARGRGRGHATGRRSRAEHRAATQDDDAAAATAQDDGVVAPAAELLGSGGATPAAQDDDDAAAAAPDDDSDAITRKTETDAEHLTKSRRLP